MDSNSFAAFAKSRCHSQLNPPYLKRWRQWYIYPQFLAHENHKIAHKNAQKSFINFKPRIGSVAITETNFAPPPHPSPPPKNLTLRVIGRVRFERYFGKMYSRHLFPYGRLMTTYTYTKQKSQKETQINKSRCWRL